MSLIEISRTILELIILVIIVYQLFKINSRLNILENLKILKDFLKHHETKKKK